MSIAAVSSKIVSTLGNPASLVPLMVKDGVDSASLTYHSYKAGGKVEGFDRFVDEFGTQAIWIGGIPFFKKIIDKTLYKVAKINPNVDPRIISNKEYAAWAIENAKGLMGDKSGQDVKDALQHAFKHFDKTKGLAIAKVGIATALTLITFFTLTKSKQKMTKNNVENEVANKKTMDDQTIEGQNFKGKINQEFLNNHVKNAGVFDGISNIKSSKTASFRGMGKNVIEGIMFNPVHNMKIIDVGITTERLAQSRNKTEFCEHAIKEGTFLFFMYGLGNVLQNGINKFANKFMKKPIDLDIQVLMSDELKSAMQSGKVATDLTKLPDAKSGLTKVLDFIVQNPDNVAVQAAKKSGIVSTVGKTLDVDTSKYISTSDFFKSAANLQNINNKFLGSKQTIDKFLNKTKGLKVAAVVLNLAACCFVLGFIVPKLVYKFRKDSTGTNNFHVAEDIKDQIDKNEQAA